MKPGEPGASQTPPDAKRLDEAVLRAAGLEGAEREDFLSELTAADPALAKMARARLAAAARVSTFLERPAAERLAGGAGRGETVSAGALGPTLAALPPEQRYRLGECLGRGGMGRVVEAYDRQLERPVALKFLTSEKPARRALFLREGRAQARVRHPHVLDVYDGGELEGLPFLSMRYVAGGTLEQIAPKLSLEHKVRLLIQVAEGLHAAHRQGLLHRDVKPANILVDESPDGDLVAYVADFGIAADVADADGPAAGAVAGTPQYVAPERLIGGEAADRRSDVYSLGVTMYKVLTGSLPYAGPMTADVLRQTVTAGLPPPRQRKPDLPVEIEAIVLRATAKDPAERYGSARAVAEDLRRYLDGEVVEAYAAGLAYRLTRFALRHRALVATAAVAAVALVAASIAVLVFALRADAARERAELRRGQAEELIRFMVVDLQRKLEAVSRLAVLDDVARAATEYFAAVPEEELSEDELLRRSRMLYQLGNLRIQQGDIAAAAAPMKESLALTRRLHQLAPDDPERLFELGQSWFWVGFVAWERGDLAAAGEAFEEYLAISKRLVEIDPDNLDWRLEVSYAHSNLGSLLQAEGNVERALAQFEDSLAIKQQLVDAGPENRSWGADLADSHNTVGVALSFLNRPDEAKKHLERELAIREALLAAEPDNRLFQSALATTHAYLGRLLANAGELEAAREHAETGYRLLTGLAEHDPRNSVTQAKLAWMHIDLGRLAFARGDVAASEREWRLAEALLDRLATSDDGSASRHERHARGALAYHFALVHRAGGDLRGRGEVLSALEIFERLAAEQALDLEIGRWRGWSYLLLAALETSPAAAKAALERAVEVLGSPAPAAGEPAGSVPRCLRWIEDLAPATEFLAAAGAMPVDPLLCAVLPGGDPTG